MARAKRYTVSDGKLVLVLQEEEKGWFTVTSPLDPAVITQARSIREAFSMARDAMAALAESRRDLNRWNRTPKKRMRRSA
jgi:predicted RNase H-like HicB family nuclease